jgi:hypothetical protein
MNRFLSDNYKLGTQARESPELSGIVRAGALIILP